MPLNELSNHIAKLKKDSVIITCCASGMRSASAKNILKSNGFTSLQRWWLGNTKKITVSQNVLNRKSLNCMLRLFCFNRFKFSNYYCIASLITLVRIKSTN
jgi:hypothetical protein